MGMAKENEEHGGRAGSNTAAAISDHMIGLVGADRMEAGANLLAGKEFHRRRVHQLIGRHINRARDSAVSTVMTERSVIKSGVLNGPQRIDGAGAIVIDGG